MNRIETLDRRIAVKDFLEHLCVTQQLFLTCNQCSKYALGGNPVRMRGSDQVHGDIRKGRPATLSFVCLDDRLTAAAEREGFPVAGMQNTSPR